MQIPEHPPFVSFGILHTKKNDVAEDGALIVLQSHIEPPAKCRSPCYYPKSVQHLSSQAWPAPGLCPAPLAGVPGGIRGMP